MIVRFAAVVSVLMLAAAPVAGQSSSPSYVLRQSTTNAGGAASTSASYALAGSSGQAAAVGTSSSPSYVLQSGFWGFVGSGLVPVYLTVSRSDADPTHVDLFWSGNNPPYDVYQATECSAVFGSFFDSTAANAVTDITPPASSLVCYSVLGTAPGPVPPPGGGR